VHSRIIRLRKVFLCYYEFIFNYKMCKNSDIGRKRQRADTVERQILTCEVLDVPVVRVVSTCSRHVNHQGATH